jgi:quinol monooxygenase YgiN
MSMSHGFHAAIPAKPGQGEALVQLLLSAPSFESDDCVVFLVGRSASNPDLVFVTEGWVNEEAHGRFFNSDVAKAFTAKVQELVGGESTYADEVPVGGKAVLGTR